MVGLKSHLESDAGCFKKSEHSLLETVIAVREKENDLGRKKTLLCKTKIPLQAIKTKENEELLKEVSVIQIL